MSDIIATMIEVLAFVIVLCWAIVASFIARSLQRETEGLRDHLKAANASWRAMYESTRAARDAEFQRQQKGNVP